MSTIPLALDVQRFLRLLIMVVLGALVHYERERTGKLAGVRPHGMVSLGAALFVVVSLRGAALHQCSSVQGLTTAARLWLP